MLTTRVRPTGQAVRWIAGLLVAAAVAGGLVPSPARMATRAAARADSEKTVFAAAIHAGTRPITDLQKSDWGVREDGVDRPIVDAKRATEPLQIVLLVDSTRPVEKAVNDVRAALAAFVKTIRNGQSSADILLETFGGNEMVVSDFGKPASDLEKAVQRFFPSQDATSFLLESVVDAAKRLSKRPSPRRVIVAINQDGAPEGGDIAPKSVSDAVIASRAAFWSLTYQVGTVQDVLESRQVVLDGLTQQTGAVHIHLNTPAALVANITRVADVLLAQYAVTYTRPDGPMPKLLQMAVARPGAQMLVPRTPPE